MQTVSYQCRHAELQLVPHPNPTPTPPLNPHSLTTIGKKERLILADKVATLVHDATASVSTVSTALVLIPFLSSDIYKEPPLPAASPAVTAEKKSRHSEKITQWVRFRWVFQRSNKEARQAGAAVRNINN